ncbi:TPA: hypothetical protein DCX16_01585 [bacterium]|nr:hypothetical protein [bacterium]
MEKGLVHVYTGEGKGKTSSACGLVCRAVGHVLRVCWVYFHKEPEKFEYGELKTLEKLGVEIYGFAKKHPHFFKDININDVRRECLDGLSFIKKIWERYDLLIMDEILISIKDKFLKEEEVLDMINSKPEALELVLTGRGATQRLIEVAGYVSEIKEIKHPYRQGIQGRKGVEY